MINNMHLLKVDPSKIQAMIVSHGHIDHYGGLIGFLEKHRGKLPADVKLYAGGEDNFCHRVSATQQAGQFGGFHLGPAPADYLTQVVAEIKKLQPDVLIPMHCSGLNFLLEARQQMPGSVINTSTGSKLIFSA